jgi:dipeptide/tripeptide permease
VIAASNKRFEMGMYAAMLLIGVGLIIYMAMTGQLKPKADAQKAPPAVEEGAGNK